MIELESHFPNFAERIVNFNPNGVPETSIDQIAILSSADILMVEDIHDDITIRNLISFNVCTELVKLGFNKYFIEGVAETQKLLDQLKLEGHATLSKQHIAPTAYSDESYARCAYAASAAGMEVVAADIVGVSLEEREEYIFQTVVSRLKPGDRVLVLFGGGHCIPGNIELGTEIPTLASRLLSSGYSILSIKSNSKDPFEGRSFNSSSRLERNYPHISGTHDL